MPWPKGKPRSAETGAKISAANRGKKQSEASRKRRSIATIERYKDPAARKKTADSLRGLKRPVGVKLSPTHCEAISKGLIGHQKSQSHREALARVAVHNWRGGKTGDLFAQLLCPAGFIREHRVRYGTGRGEVFRIDFAHVDGKVAIELDGPRHKSSKDHDALRDSFLKTLGWRVIRIKHD